MVPLFIAWMGTEEVSTATQMLPAVVGEVGVIVGLVHPPEQSTNFVWTMWGPVTRMLAVAVPEIAPIVAVIVSDPMLTPDTTPVEALIVECAPVSVQTGRHGDVPAATGGPLE